jgi:alpha-glucoside transport system substrate-binding protein
MSLRIQLLGPPRMSLGGHPVDLPGHRPLALLAYLVTTGQPHSRSHLIDLLFEGPDDPRAALRWTLSKLRKAIGSDYILTDRQEVSFNFQSDFWLDVSAFQAGEIELFQGDFLEGLYLRDALRFEEWLLFERERLRGQYQAGLEQQLEMHERQDDAAAVVTTAHLLLKQDNLREDWQRALMKAYARLGKRETALAQFEQCRQVLRAELGVDPSPETLALVEAIQSGQVGLDNSPVTSPASPQRRMPTSIGQSNQPMSAPVPNDVENETVMVRQIRPVLSLSWVFFGILGAVTLIVVLAMVLSSIVDFNSWADFSKSSSSPNHVDQPGPLAGTTVTIVGPGRDEQQKLFEQSMGPFEERTGINVVYIVAADQLKSFVKARVEQGYPPDIAAFPQPGLLAEFVRQGKIVDLRTFLSDDYLQQQYTDTFLELATVDGKMAGVWHNAFLKSLVWYPKQPFEARGYEVPETWDELMALSDRIVADGGIPWCIGIESGDNSGWVGTDWVEDILLRTAPSETYDAWARHDLPFNSPEIRRVFEIMGQIWLNDDYVHGGVVNISTESWRDSAVHLFEDPPGCFLHRQASFVRYVFPQTARYGQDYDFFYLPPIDPEFGHPVLGGGDIFAMFNDRPEVREVVRYLTTAESARALVEGGGFISPHRNTPLEWYPSAAELRFAQIILSADTYRFDGSDLMPREVGAGSFWSGITDWVEGTDLETVLQEIDNSWPE